MKNFITNLKLKHLILILVITFFITILLLFLFFSESFAIIEAVEIEQSMQSYSKNNSIEQSYSSSINSTLTLNSVNSTQTSNSFYDIEYISSNSSINPKSLNTFSNKITSTQTPVLMYHYVDDREIDQKKDPVGYNLTVKSTTFEKDMRTISAKKYKTLFASELVNYNSLSKDNYLALTFDDGYEDFYRTAFPILRKYNIKSTIYIITSYVGKSGYLNWNEIEELKNSNLVEIGSHTQTHPNLQTSSVEIQRKQIFESKKILENKLKIKIKSFCYPSGKFSEDTVKLVEEAGYTNATTTIRGYFQKSKNLYEIYRFRVGPDGVAKYL